MQGTPTEFRATGVIVGILFIIATSFLFLGEFFYRPHLDSPDVLQVAAENRGAVVLGLTLELVCILAMPLIGAFIFAVLARVGTGVALAYFFFRALEAMILIDVALTNKFALLSLSEALVAGGDAAQIAGAVALIRAQNAWADTAAPVYNLAFALGALCLYGTLYRARLVPRWISLWGMLAIVILLGLVAAAVFFGPLPGWVALLLLPIAVQEMVMALWFILRGFDLSALAAPGSDTAQA